MGGTIDRRGIGAAAITLLAATLGFGLLSGGTASATMPGKPGLIAFNSDRDGDFEIYVTGPDGGEPTQLTDNTFTDRKPAFSADGSQIAFQSDRDGDFDLYVMNADGSGVRQITDSPGDDFNPASR